MPLYEYECESCGARIERIQPRFSDPLLQTCPTCSGQLRKLISSPAIQFKGSGFYITDYARKSGTDGTAASETKDAKDAKDTKGENKGAKDDSKSSQGESSPASESASPSKPAETSSSAPAKTDTKS